MTDQRAASHGARGLWGRLDFNRGLALAGAVALLAAWLVYPNLAGHGLQAVYSTGEKRVERIALLTANAHGLTPAVILHTTWDGYLYQPRPVQVVFRVPQGVAAQLTLDGNIVYTAGAGSPPQAAVRLDPGFHPIHFEVTSPAGLPAYFQAGLEWRTPLGWRLVPPAYLYPAPVDAAQAAGSVQRRRAALALAALGALAGLALAARLAGARRRRLFSRPALALAALVLLALALRLLILRDLAAAPTADILPLGSDHRGYHTSALDALRGLWPASAFRIQPGIIVALAAIYGLLGPSIRAAQIVQMLLGAAATVAVFAVARSAFGDVSAWCAALLWAIFPQPIFYEGQLLTHGLEAPAGALLLWLWLRALQGRRWPRLAALGLALGAAAVLRPTFLLLAPLICATLLWRRPRPRLPQAAVLCAVLALAVLLPIAPATWWNYHADGRFQLISSQSSVTLYLSNNRDSTGLGEISPAYRAAHTLVNLGQTTYLAQTLADIRAEPLRWLQLMARKLALYAGNPELPNNVDFYAQGTAHSPLLAGLPLRFGAMLALALAGAAAAVRRKRLGQSAVQIVFIYSLMNIGVTVIFGAYSRFRAPLYPALAILGGCALAALWAGLRGWPASRRAVGQHALTLAACAGLIAAMPWTAEHVMNRPVMAELPAASRRLDAPIGPALTLVGYDPLPAVEPGEPVFVTLYWQASQPLAADLYATVQILSVAEPGSDTKFEQADHLLGTGSFPDYPPQEWRPGQIVRDSYLIEMPADAPTPRGLTVLAAAYHRETGQRIGERSFGPLPLTYARPLEPPAEAQVVGAQVGPATLAAYSARVDAGALTVTLYWTAGEPLAADGVVFLHLLDAGGQFVLGQDAPPLGGLYGTRAWQPGEGVVDEHTIPLPADLPPGVYQLETGMYDAETQTRLAVVDAAGQPVPDMTVRLGEVVVP